MRGEYLTKKNRGFNAPVLRQIENKSKINQKKTCLLNITTYICNEQTKTNIMNSITLNEKLAYIYKVMPKIDANEVGEYASKLSLEDRYKSPLYLRMQIGDIRCTIECEGNTTEYQRQLEGYTHKLYQLLTK